MNPFKKNAPIDPIRQILKDRGIDDRKNALAYRHSNGRTNELNKLNAKEIESLLSALNEFTDKTILQAIYQAAFELKVIKEPTPSKVNEELIISYLKANGIIDFITNEIEVSNPKGKVVITVPFFELNFISKELLLSVLGEVILKRLSILN